MKIKGESKFNSYQKTDKHTHTHIHIHIHIHIHTEYAVKCFKDPAPFSCDLPNIKTPYLYMHSISLKG